MLKMVDLEFKPRSLIIELVCAFHFVVASLQDPVYYSNVVRNQGLIYIIILDPLLFSGCQLWVHISISCGTLKISMPTPLLKSIKSESFVVWLGISIFNSYHSTVWPVLR